MIYLVSFILYPDTLNECILYHVSCYFFFSILPNPGYTYGTCLTWTRWQTDIFGLLVTFKGSKIILYINMQLFFFFWHTSTLPVYNSKRKTDTLLESRFFIKKKKKIHIFPSRQVKSHDIYIKIT